MEEIFGVIDGRFRVSIVDSTMMSIVHRAMDKAHGRVKSREGVLERLHEISKFYELSVMQLDGCIMFVQEETDSHNPESGHEEVLAGLAEIRNRLQRRLYESELAILQKDRELRDRFESESKLRQALEITERELVSSQEDLEIERTRSAGSSNLSHQSGEDDNRDGEFCELKDSVDRQVWKIREKLEVDDYEPEENKRNHCMNDVKVEEVGSDIDMLKETLDMAFGKMQSAIFYSEMGPIEQQIKSSIENDIISINLRGFVRDSQEDLEAEVRRKEKQQISVSLNEHWTDLMNEVTGLCEDLKPLIIRQNETQPQDGEECDISDFGSRSPKREKNSAEYGININEKELEDEGSHDVAKMIENHESVISEKSAEAEEQIRLRQEILGLSSRRGGNPVSLESRIQRVLEKQENIIILNAKVNKIFGQHGDVNEEDIPLERKEQIFTETDRQKSDVDTLTDVWGKMHKLQDEEITGQIRNQISMLMQEREEKEFQNIMMEEIYITIFKGLIERFGNNLRSWELEIQISDGICRDFIRNMFNQQNEAMESYKIEVHIKDDIYYGICRDFIRDVFDQQNETMESYKIEAHIKDDIYYGICRDFIRDVFDQQNEAMENYKIEAHIKDDIYYGICRDFIRNMFDQQNEIMESYKIEAHIKDDLYYGTCKDFIRNVFDQQDETMESYKIEAHVKDYIYYGICRDFIRNMFDQQNETMESYKIEAHIKDDMYYGICRDFIRDVFDQQNETVESYKIEAHIKDDIYYDIYKDLFRNMFEQQNEVIESYKIEAHIKDDMYYGICSDFIRDIFDQQNETVESYKIEAHIKDDMYYGICRDFIRDVFDQQNETIESYKVEAHIKDDIYYDICRDFIKNVFDHQNETMENYKIDAHIKDDIYYGICRDFIKNVFDQQNETMESYKIEAHIKHDMYYGICRDFIKNVFDQQNETMESYKIDTHIKDNIYYGICTNFIKDVFDQHNETMESYKIEAHVKDDIYYVVLNEAMKGYCSTYDLRVARKTENVKDEDLYLEGLTSDNDLSQCSECEIRSEIYGIPFAVMLNEWQKSIGEHTTESLLKEEVSWFVFGETIKSITYKANQCPDSRITIEEDVCSVFYREMVREWEEKIEACNLENSIREEICYAVLIQAEREVRNRYKRADVPIQDSDAAEKPPSRKRRDKGFSSLESLVQKLDLLSEGIDVDENLVLSASFEIKDYNSNLKLVVFECGFDESKTTFVESKVIECILASLSNKLEKTMEQINNNKLILRKLKSSLETIVSQPEKDCLISPVQENVPDRKLWLSEVHGVQLNKSDSECLKLLELQHIFYNFELMANKKLGAIVLRLEEMKHTLDPLAQVMASLQKKKSLYKKAFISRCQNLRKAENEVDLLGDQVDIFLSLIEKIYLILNHHSPVLQQYFDVSEILRLIKKEVAATVYTPTEKLDTSYDV